MKPISGASGNKYSSLALPGKPVNIEVFRNWVRLGEETFSMTLEEAKKRWNERKEKLQQRN